MRSSMTWPCPSCTRRSGPAPSAGPSCRANPGTPFSTAKDCTSASFSAEGSSTNSLGLLHTECCVSGVTRAACGPTNRFLYLSKAPTSERTSRRSSAMGAYDEIEIEDMTWNEELQAYTYSCPCGDLFQISKEELQQGEDVARCPSCSLYITVIYNQEDFQPPPPAVATPSAPPPSQEVAVA